MIKKPSWLLNSSAYAKASALVDDALKNSKAMSKLIRSAKDKMANNKNAGIADLFKTISACFRLLKCYVEGTYRDISLQSIALIAASIIYFVMPFDVVPDFIVGLGYLDDIAILSWTFRSVSDELKRFIEWEQQTGVIIEGEVIESPDSE